jgi:release factor glutamine methyltransferase
MNATALLAEAGGVLAAAGVPSPHWDAERLLRYVLGLDRAALFASPRRAVPTPDVERFRELVRRRASREPLQYILGTAAFWKHEFLVTPAVLIPRPETELLVETALELVKGVERPVVVDVGTGSGCIALSIAAERPDAVVHATDISERALQVALMNQRRLGLGQRTFFHRGQLLEPLTGLEEQLEVHLVLSNPPYVDPAEVDSLAPEVRDHEPREALVPPGDALAVYRRLVPAAARTLREGGALAVEVSPFIPDAVARLMAEAGFVDPAVRDDLAGRPRVVFGRLPCHPPSVGSIRPRVG